MDIGRSVSRWVDRSVIWMNRQIYHFAQRVVRQKALVAARFELARTFAHWESSFDLNPTP